MACAPGWISWSPALRRLPIHCPHQKLIAQTLISGALDEVEWLRSRLEILESSLLASSSDGRLLNRCRSKSGSFPSKFACLRPCLLHSFSGQVRCSAFARVTRLPPSLLSFLSFPVFFRMVCFCRSCSKQDTLRNFALSMHCIASMLFPAAFHHARQTN